MVSVNSSDDTTDLTMQSPTTSTTLDQEQIDMLTAHLQTTTITDEAVGTALRDLDDIEDGAGNWPTDWRPHCHKCTEEIGESELMGVAFGNYYHKRCVPSLSKGPMPLGQYLAGIDNAERQ